MHFNSKIAQLSLSDLGSWADEQVNRLHDEGMAIRRDDEVIYAYTRSQALADGALVDV
jgi:hypothetical protein